MQRTRKHAIEALERSYWTGKPCKYGHVAKRYTISGACSTCVIELSLANQRLLRDHFRAAGLQK